MDKLADKPYFQILGPKAKTEVQNIFLAFYASGLFDKFPDPGTLANQKLGLKTDVLSATKIIDQLRTSASSKVERVMGEAPKADIMKLITG
jgi:hypothetical protein